MTVNLTGLLATVFVLGLQTVNCCTLLALLYQSVQWGRFMLAWLGVLTRWV